MEDRKNIQNRFKPVPRESILQSFIPLSAHWSVHPPNNPPIWPFCQASPNCCWVQGAGRLSDGVSSNSSLTPRGPSNTRLGHRFPLILTTVSAPVSQMRTVRLRERLRPGARDLEGSSSFGATSPSPAGWPWSPLLPLLARSSHSPQPPLPTPFILKEPPPPATQSRGFGTSEFQPRTPLWFPRAHNFHLHPFLINFLTKCVP